MSAPSIPSPEKHVTIYSDGGCHGNPGPGGWAAVLVYGERTREISGGESATTNNRMELLAAIRALEALKEPCVVSFHTDSKYVKSGITEWLRKWKAAGWRARSRNPVKNIDLWQALDLAASRHQIQWKWVRGHAGNKFNEQCDRLATEQITHIKSHHTPAQLKASLGAFEAAKHPGPSKLELF